MTGWTPRRFWKEARAVAMDGGFAVQLDARQVRTPARAPLVLPTEALAAAIAAEWQAQGETVDPATMPLTRTANSAIDKVTPGRAEVAAMLAAYAQSDLLCHRAGAPQALAARQAAGWDPLLAWAGRELGAPLVAVTGVMPAAQPAASLSRLGREVAALDPFRLAAFHDLVAISGSLVLALALVRGHVGAGEAWDLCRIDEAWQAARWGIDEEAAAAESLRRAAFLDAYRFFGLCG